jgi:hypothetical protein
VGLDASLGNLVRSRPLPAENEMTLARRVERGETEARQLQLRDQPVARSAAARRVTRAVRLDGVISDLLVVRAAALMTAPDGLRRSAQVDGSTVAGARHARGSACWLARSCQRLPECRNDRPALGARATGRSMSSGPVSESLRSAVSATRGRPPGTRRPRGDRLEDRVLETWQLTASPCRARRQSHRTGDGLT